MATFHFTQSETALPFTVLYWIYLTAFNNTWACLVNFYSKALLSRITHFCSLKIWHIWLIITTRAQFNRKDYGRYFTSAQNINLATWDQGWSVFMKIEVLNVNGEWLSLNMLVRKRAGRTVMWGKKNRLFSSWGFMEHGASSNPHQLLKCLYSTFPPLKKKKLNRFSIPVDQLVLLTEDLVLCAFKRGMVRGVGIWQPIRTKWGQLEGQQVAEGDSHRQWRVPPPTPASKNLDHWSRTDMSQTRTGSMSVISEVGRSTRHDPGAGKLISSGFQKQPLYEKQCEKLANTDLFIFLI